MARRAVALIFCFLTAVGQARACAELPEESAAAAPESVLPVPLPRPVIPAAAPYNEHRILGIMPDFQTITERQSRTAPLTRKQKFGLALKESIDPFNVVNAAMTAGFSQAGNETPKYGQGGRAYGERFGAAMADFTTQNFFSAGVLASLLHQDPRYFRKGEGAHIPSRVLYAVSRLVVARQDSGRAAFNASGIFGMTLGIAASNLYYPSASVRGSVMAGRVETSLLGGVTGNLISEFWPDLQRLQNRIFHRKQR